MLTRTRWSRTRPWKAEQLGGGYRISSWQEKAAVESAAAVISVSAGTRNDILEVYPQVDPDRVHVVYHGIDAEQYQAVSETDVLARYGIDPAVPYAIFIGRITRQKGLGHLLRAARELPGQLVLCAGAFDTPKMAAEAADQTATLQNTRDGVFGIGEMLPRPDTVQLLSHATVLVCPPVYEPLGIVNLEAMACGRLSSPPRSAASPRSSSTGKPATWCRMTRATRRALRQGSRPGPPSFSRTPPRRRRWALSAGNGPCRTSAAAAIAHRTIEIYQHVLGS